MSILSSVGRKSWRTRSLVAAIYLLLSIGATAILYPFAIMLAGSTKSAVDSTDNAMFPPFLLSDVELYKKDVEAFFNENLMLFQTTFRRDEPSFRSVAMLTKVNPVLDGLWRRFLESEKAGAHAYEIAYIACPRSLSVQPNALRSFKARLQTQYMDIPAMNMAMGSDFADWNSVAVQPDIRLARSGQPPETPFLDAYRSFKASQPESDRIYFDIEGFFVHAYLKNEYGRSLDALNKAWGTAYKSWSEPRLPRRLPSSPGMAKDWAGFVESVANLAWIVPDPAMAPAFQNYLKAKYSSLENLCNVWRADYSSFESISLPAPATVASLPATDFSRFLQGWIDSETGLLHKADPAQLSIDCLAFRFRDWLGRQFDSPSAVGAEFASWDDILIPQADAHLLNFENSKTSLRIEYSLRNYLSVLDYLALRGRGLLNTAIYCILAVLSALLVNPLAAYALSRHRPKSTYRLLLFLMVTMAFPPMVTQIPVFLMLREFDMLNTFWALILPGLANGYSIFLLKGFFDSLPKELYECASIDGASEMTMFWRISMTLSGPILSVVALNAFTNAYSNFMMALLVCQDQSMWTLMPWLYQLQQNSCQGIVYASLIVSAVPTLFVFVLCQNVMMRGIAVPAEK